MKIHLYKGWSKKIDLPLIRRWCRERLILNGDWDFIVKGIAQDGEINAVIIFEDDEAGLAFKLTFGL